MKVFLGGTCAGSMWREELIPLLSVDYFNPVVEIWDEKAKEIEDAEKDICDIHLYVITPRMKGVYSIAELMHDACWLDGVTIFAYVEEDDGLTFNDAQLMSLEAIEDLLRDNHCLYSNTHIFTGESFNEIAQDIAEAINECGKYR